MLYSFYCPRRDSKHIFHSFIQRINKGVKFSSKEGASRKNYKEINSKMLFLMALALSLFSTKYFMPFDKKRA